MRKIIRIKPPIAVQCTHRYKFKGKTYIVQSSYWLPNKGTEGGSDISYRLKDRIEYILAQDPPLTAIDKADTISSSVDVLSARKEQ